MKSTVLRIAIGAAFAAATALAPSALAAPPVMSVGAASLDAPPRTAPGKNKLECFDGTTDEGSTQGGTCTRQGRGAMGPAILDVTSDNAEGAYAGVYYLESSIYGAPLGDIKQLRFHYIATDDEIAFGNLALNIPIDANGDGVFDPDAESYASIDISLCPGTDGVVDAIEDDECVIFYAGDEYENWAAFVDALEEASPDAVVAAEERAALVATRGAEDGPATYRVNAVKIGKPGR